MTAARPASCLHAPGIELGKHAFLIGAAVLTYLPLWLMIAISFKSIPQFYRSVWTLEFPLQFANYATAWNVVLRYLGNSVLITGAIVIGVVILSSLAAFAFARYRFPGRNLLFWMVLVLLFVPFILTMVPAFVWVRDLGLINTRWGVILPTIASQQVFAIFILRSFIASLPEELFEAARLDGATLFDCYWRIALPLARPILSVVVITTLISSWNDFIWPLIVISDDALRTIPIGLAFFQRQYSTNYGPQMAGYVIASVPMVVLFLFTTREFIRGLTSGAIKM